MLEPFSVEDNSGQKFSITCERHNGVCWRLIFRTQTVEYAGDLLFEPVDTECVRLLDFHIFPEFARKGTGTRIINKLQGLLRQHGYRSIVAICKSYDRPLSEKENLAEWYANLGFTLIREKMATEPGYMGKLFKNL